MATYVVSDIHGEYGQLRELLCRMKFQDTDELYVIGDIVDRGPHPIKTLQYLMTLPNCFCIAGNHEVMALTNLKLLLQEVTDDFLSHLSPMKMGLLSDWIKNGASSTISEFSKLSMEERLDIVDYLEEFEAYIKLKVKGKKYLLVHAGISHFAKEKKLDEYTIDDFVWTRTDYSNPYYEDCILITGHTPTHFIPENDKPGYIYKGNGHIAIDCGAYFDEGRLAGICLETGEEFYAR